MMANHFDRLVKTTLPFGFLAFAMLPAAPSLAGSLVLVGGNWAYPGVGGDAEPYGVSIYEEVINLAGGADSASIGIFTTASSASSAPGNGALYVEDFQALYPDIDVEWIPFTIGNCEGLKNDASFAATLSGKTGFVFGGGDQSRITDCFFDQDPIAGTRTNSLVFDALEAAYQGGAVVAGTSAGTTVQAAEPMITEGQTYEALVYDPISLIDIPPIADELYYNPLGGFGFFNYGLLDTHFSQWGRQGRIIRLAAETGKELTFGVDENTALIVSNPDTPEVSFTVLGEGGVFISDLGEATVGEKNGYWTISDVQATYLTEGDQYNPLTQTATVAPSKSSIAGLEELASVPVEEDIFSSLKPEPPPDVDGRANERALTETAIALVNSKATQAFGVSYETEPVQYGVLLTKPGDVAGFIGLDNQGAEKISFQNLNLAIAPVPEPGSVLGFLGMGLAGIGVWKKRQRSHS
ncbi:MAG: cyanophycinase [Leptolyngbyaceae cyanobacterium SL_7_1]|nr:cyanophycinase [Leptolyngbyaceae cyanobacterium SL_7_1]